MLALLGGRLAEADRLVGQAAMLGEECGEPGVQDVRYDQGWELLTAQGRLGELAGALPQMFPDTESVQARGAGALVLLASGARAEAADVAAPLFEGDPEPAPRDNQSLLAAAYASELVAAFGVVPAAENCTRRCCRSPARRRCPAWPSRSRAQSRTISACWPRRSAGPQMRQVTWSRRSLGMSGSAP